MALREPKIIMLYEYWLMCVSGERKYTCTVLLSANFD